jgi:hypothetical protein
MKEAAELPLGKEWMFVMSLWQVWKSPTTESFVWRAHLMLLTSTDVLFWFEGQNALKPYRSCRCFVRGSTCAWPLDALSALAGTFNPKPAHLIQSTCQGHSWLSTGPTENVRMCLAWLKKTTMSAGARWHPYTIPWHAALASFTCFTCFTVLSKSPWPKALMLSAFGLKLPARSSLASQDSQVQWNEVWWSLCILMKFMNLMVGRFCVLSWMLCVLTQCFAWSLLRLVVIKHEITWVRSPHAVLLQNQEPCGSDNAMQLNSTRGQFSSMCKQGLLIL